MQSLVSTKICRVCTLHFPAAPAAPALFLILLHTCPCNFFSREARDFFTPGVFHTSSLALQTDVVLSVRQVLHSLDGAMFTGCDLNSTLDDMAYLADKSPYILAAIGNDKVERASD